MSIRSGEDIKEAVIEDFGEGEDELTASRHVVAVEAGHSQFKKPKAVEDLAEVNEVARSSFIILPWVCWYKTWWYFTVFCAFLTIFTESFNIAFTPAGLKPINDGSSIIELTLVAIFALDILITFCLAYYDECNIIVVDRWQITMHYLKNMFTLDVIGVFPFYAIALIATDEIGNDSRLAQYLSLLRLLRFVRLHRMVKVFEIVQYSSKISLFQLTLTRNLLMAIVWVHFNACMFYFISKVNGFVDGGTWIGDTSTWTTYNQYVTSLYFTMVTFTTVGYGDMSPKNNPERIYDVMFMLANITFSAWMIGSISLLIVKSDTKTGLYRDLLQTLERFWGTHEQLDPSFQKVLRNEVRLEFNNRDLDEEAILSRFPTAVRRRVLRRIYLPDLSKGRIVRGLDPQFLDSMLAAMKLQVVSPGGEVIERGAVSSKLYFLMRGVAKLVPEVEDKTGYARQHSSSGSSVGAGESSLADSDLHAKGLKVLELRSGQFMNDVAFFTESAQRESLRCKTVCRFLTISRTDYQQIAEEHPKSVTLLLNNLLEKYEAKKANCTEGSMRPGEVINDSMHGSEYGDEIQKQVRSVQYESDTVAIRRMIEKHTSKQKNQQVNEFLFAAYRGDTEAVQLMMSGQDSIHPDATDYDQRTALMVAAMKGHTETALKLIEWQANPNLLDVHGSSALYEAATNGHDRTVQALLEKGASLCLPEATAAAKLCHAVSDGDMAMLHRLLKARINPDAADINRRTAAHVAAVRGNIQALKLLADHGASVLRVRDRWNVSVMDEAKKSQEAQKTVKFLQSL